MKVFDTQEEKDDFASYTTKKTAGTATTAAEKAAAAKFTIAQSA